MTPNVDIGNLNNAKLNNELKKYENLNSKNMEDKDLRKVSNEFESFFLQQMLDVSLKNTNVAGEGVGADIIKGMYSEAVAKNSAGSFGISDMLYKFLSENNKK
ncbi:MAG: rod-binding protein [Sphaerochaetaceae bacterium]|nr:rod-binding protein [Sphaerochaetaceae bacterium]